VFDFSRINNIIWNKTSFLFFRNISRRQLLITEHYYYFLFVLFTVLG